MNEKEMIEEMAKEMCSVCLSIEEPCYMKKQPCNITKKQAEALYNTGYRNCKDKVVLSKEEYQNDFNNQFNKGYKHGSKETAKEIYHKLMHDFIGLDEIGIKVLKSVMKNHYGVEVEE